MEINKLLTQQPFQFLLFQVHQPLVKNELLHVDPSYLYAFGVCSKLFPFIEDVAVAEKVLAMLVRNPIVH